MGQLRAVRSFQTLQLDRADRWLRRGIKQTGSVWCWSVSDLGTDRCARLRTAYGAAHTIYTTSPQRLAALPWCFGALTSVVDGWLGLMGLLLQCAVCCYGSVWWNYGCKRKWVQ